MQAVAAEALLPGAALLAGGPAGGPAGTEVVLALLWNALLELEELSPATGSVMTLFAEIHACPGADAAAAATIGEGPTLGALVPRLWPFLRHGLTSVRAATLRCLSALLRSQPVSALLPGEELQRGARLLFQSLLLERSAEVLAAAQQAWQLLVQRAEPSALAEALPVQPALGALFQLAATPAHASLDASLMLTVPLPRKRAGSSASKAALAGRGASSAQLAEQQQQQHERQRENLVVEGDNDAARTTRMRLAAAQALGQLAHALGSSAVAPNPAQAQVEALLRGGTATGRLLASFVVTRWAQLHGDGSAGGTGGAGAVPTADPGLQQLLGVLLELLAVPAAAATQGYAELSQLHAQLRGRASAFISRTLAAGVALAMPAPLEALGHAGALALVAQVPAAGGEEAGGLRQGALGGLWKCAAAPLPSASSSPAASSPSPFLSLPCRRSCCGAGAGTAGAAGHGQPAAGQRGAAAHQRVCSAGGGRGAPGLPAPQAQHHHPTAGGAWAVWMESGRAGAFCGACVSAAHE